MAAGSPDLSDGHKGFLKDFLRRADQVKFARHLPDADYIEEVLLAAGRFLDQTRDRPADRSGDRGPRRDQDGSGDRDPAPSERSGGGRPGAETEAAHA